MIDDGSTDSHCFDLISDLPVHVLKHTINLGQGAAIETGIRKALQMKKKLFVTFDADGQHSFESVFDLLGKLSTTNSDIVFGSRFLNSEFAKAVPLMKRLVLKLATLFDGVLTGVWLTDSHNGMRAFNSRVAEMIHFTENRMAHATEILWLTKKFGWKYDECAALIHYDSKSQHPSKSIEIAIDLFLRKFIS